MKKHQAEIDEIDGVVKPRASGDKKRGGGVGGKRRGRKKGEVNPEDQLALKDEEGNMLTTD